MRRAVRALSIPLWCDWDGRGSCRGWCCPTLSIPLWCDWDERGIPFHNPYRLTFNPTVVRLGPVPPEPLLPFELDFQSHCGAIGTPARGPQGRAEGRPFNPTVVRLGHQRVTGAKFLVPSFNPTVVRLGQTVSRDSISTRYPFNPTVVRLGRLVQIGGGALVLSFQSHCGAIGTGASTTAASFISVLSIPLWCDWDSWDFSMVGGTCYLSIPLWCDWDGVAERHIAGPDDLSIPLWCDWDHWGWCSRRRRGQQLSIPLWCDWDGAPAAPGSPPMRLSIPLWCDWDPRQGRQDGRDQAAFNPTVVRLGRSSRALAPGTSPPFNPTVVRLGPQYYAMLRRILPAFNPTVVRLGRAVIGGACVPAGALSIPLWCDWDAEDVARYLETAWLAFNPTVVRLGHRPGMVIHVLGQALSIPLWCDWDC